MPDNQYEAVRVVKKDGLFTLQDLARTACRVARWAAPIIQTKYPFNVPLMVALQAAMVACEALDLEIEKQQSANQGVPPDEPVTGGGGGTPLEPDPEPEV